MMPDFIAFDADMAVLITLGVLVSLFAVALFIAARRVWKAEHMNIKTARDWMAGRGWIAWDDFKHDGMPRSPVGRGQTPEAAIADLMEQIDERKALGQTNDYRK